MSLYVSVYLVLINIESAVVVLALDYFQTTHHECRIVVLACLFNGFAYKGFLHQKMSAVF